MKAQIELNIPDDRMFLNFWNFLNGDDVVGEIIDNKIYIDQFNENGEEIDRKEVTLQEFCEMVKQRI